MIRLLVLSLALKNLILSIKYKILIILLKKWQTYTQIINLDLNLSEVPDLKLDKESTSRVLINLIKNSIEADSSNIKISTTQEDNFVKIIFTDDGRGF